MKLRINGTSRKRKNYDITLKWNDDHIKKYSIGYDGWHSVICRLWKHLQETK